MTSISGGQITHSTSEHFNLSEVVKKNVTKILSTHFPTVLLAYTIFRDVKNDRFIILSGFLIRVVFPIEFMISRTISDEL